MQDLSKTKQVLIQELVSLRQRIAELEQSESRRKEVRFVYSFLIILTIVVMLFVGGPASGTCNAAGNPREVHVGSELDFPPYALVDKNGQPAGFSVELIKAVTDAMGLSIKISTGSWDTVWNSLVSGQLDVLPIVAKLPERQRLVDFSLPHTETYDAFFVRKGDPAIPNIAAAQGKEIVVMRSDAAHHALIERNFQGKLILIDTIPAGLKLLSSGKHNAVLCSKLIGTLAIKEHGITGLIAGPTIPDYKRVFSFAVKKGETELLEKLNQGLLIVKTSGEYNLIYDKWLSFDDPWRKVQKYILPAIITLIVIVVIAGFWLVTLRRLVRKRTRELNEKNEMLLHAYDNMEVRVQERTKELAQSNQLLQGEITEHKRVEDDLRQRTHELGERVKELNCLHGLSELSITIGDSLDMFLQGVTELLPPALQYPPIACARITLDGQILNTANFEQTRWRMQRFIHVLGKQIGTVEVCYLEARPDSYEGPFLQQEGRLLDMVAERLGRAAERIQTRQALQKSEERFRLAINATEDGLWEWDIQTNQEFFSSRWCEIIGYSFDDPELPHTYDSWVSRIHPDDYDRVINAMKNHLENGAEYNVEYRHRHKSGEYRWQNSKGKAAFDENGKPIKMVGCISDVTDRKQAEVALRESEKRLQSLTSQLISAQEDERRRISLELHDEMGQTLTAIKFNLTEIENDLPLDSAPTIKENVEEAKSFIDHASDQMHELSHNLRPSMLDDLGLVPTVRWHLNRFGQMTDIEAKFEAVDLDERLDQATETALYRIVQESLNNITKHAEAKKVLVRLQRKGDAVAAYIEDDGKGFDMNEISLQKTPETGIGLMGMQQRAHMIGGILTIDSHKGHGTRISIEAPLHGREVKWAK